jgi:hypothetical protein
MKFVCSFWVDDNQQVIGSRYIKFGMEVDHEHIHKFCMMYCL